MYIYVKESVSKLKTKGYAKELLTGTRELENGLIINTHWYSDDCFIRNPKSTYSIFLCKSYRENGKSKTKQYKIATISYWDIAESYEDDFIDWLSPEFDDILWVKMLAKIDSILAEDGCLNGLSDDEQKEYLYKIQDDLSEKCDCFWNKIVNSFKKTKEYRVHEEHRQILEAYHTNKMNFLEDYDCYPDEYDVCFDIYGRVTNSEYLSRIQSRHSESDFNSGHSSGRSTEKIVYRDANYSKTELQYLKKFYKTLATKYHPDTNNNKTTGEMKFINKLKEQWGI